MTLRVDGSLSFTATDTVTLTGLISQLSLPVQVSETISMLNGSGAGQVNKRFFNRRTITGLSQDDWDLAGGVTDFFNTTFTFAAIKLLYIKAAAANVDALRVGAAPSNAWLGPFQSPSYKLDLLPGTRLFLYEPTAGYPVVAGTGDILRIAAPVGNVDYDIVLLGV